MKIKNVVTGLRVELKQDFDHLVAGSQGTVIRASSETVDVRWDTYDERSHTFLGRCDAGHGWCVMPKCIRKIK